MMLLSFYDLKPQDHRPLIMIIRALYEIRGYPGNYPDSLTKALREGLTNAELALHDITGVNGLGLTELEKEKLEEL